MSNSKIKKTIAIVLLIFMTYIGTTIEAFNLVAYPFLISQKNTLIPAKPVKNDKPKLISYESKSCGANVKCRTDSSGNITLSGQGNMYDYDYNNSPPWTSYHNLIRSLVIKKGITSIGDNAFSGCTALKSKTNFKKNFFDFIPIPRYYQFSGCKNLETVVIPGTVVSIGKRAFQNCAKLTSLKIPSSVTSIKDLAFSGCSGLTSLTYLGENDPGIGSEKVFSNCDKLRYVSVSDSYKDDYFCGKPVKHTLVFGKCGENLNWLLDTTGALNVFGEGLMTNYESIDQMPWHLYKNFIKSVEIEKGVTSIGKNAFSFCEKLNSIRISSSVDFIGDGAFSGCTNLNSVTYFGEDDPTASSKEVFDNCNKLVSVSVHDNYRSNKFCNLPVIEVIAVAMSTDNNYVDSLIVTLTSILKNKNPNTQFEFYILLSGNFDTLNKNKIIEIGKKHNDCNIVFIDMKNIEKQGLKDAYTSGHITTATYYRLWLPKLLPELNKILYLDIDSIVKKDLYDLFKTDITNYYIAGVRENGNGPFFDGEAKSKGYKSYADILGIPSMDQYINAGILLMNLDKMRKDNIFESFSKVIAEKKLPLHDQDTINIVCYNKILFLNFKYNCMQHFLKWSESDKKYIATDTIKKIYSHDELENAYKDPVIVHFAEHKPWKKKDVPNSDLWWTYFKESIGFPKDEIL